MMSCGKTLGQLYTHSVEWKIATIETIQYTDTSIMFMSCLNTFQLEIIYVIKHSNKESRTGMM